MKEKCCKHDLKRKILRSINSTPFIKKTKLMIRVNTCYKSLNQYLGILIKENMIILNKGTFKLTEKGLDYLSLLNSLRKLENE